MYVSTYMSQNKKVIVHVQTEVQTGIPSYICWLPQKVIHIEFVFTTTGLREIHSLCMLNCHVQVGQSTTFSTCVC